MYKMDIGWKRWKHELVDIFWNISINYFKLVMHPRTHGLYFHIGTASYWAYSLFLYLSYLYVGTQWGFICRLELRWRDAAVEGFCYCICFILCMVFAYHFTFPLVILYCYIHFGMNSHTIRIWDSANIHSWSILQLTHIVLYYSLEGKFIPLIIYIDILRFYSVIFTVMTLIVRHVCLRAGNPLYGCWYLLVEHGKNLNFIKVYFGNQLDQMTLFHFISFKCDIFSL